MASVPMRYSMMFVDNDHSGHMEMYEYIAQHSAETLLWWMDCPEEENLAWRITFVLLVLESDGEGIC